MIRSAFFLCACIIASVCVSCAAPPLTPSIAGANAPGGAVCSAVANLSMVSASFDPTSAMNTPVPAGAAPANITADVIGAYNAAPQFFRDELCGLTGIFITPTAQSWGFRNIRDGSRYIALSASLWSGGGPITLDALQNKVFGPPLSWPGPPTDASPPLYLPARPGGGSTTILAALAHEFGHVLWADVLVSPRGSAPQSTRFCNRILSESWTNGPQPRIWTQFGDIDTNASDVPDDASDPPPPSDPGPGEAKVQRMKDALAQGRIARAHKILGRILALARPFPSLLGAFSANEQFVETFELYTLLHANPPLTSLPLQVSPGSVSDIPATIGSRPRLLKMLRCFDSITGHP